MNCEARRATASVGPPGAAGTTMRIGLADRIAAVRSPHWRRRRSRPQQRRCALQSASHATEWSAFASQFDVGRYLSHLPLVLQACFWYPQHGHTDPEQWSHLQPSHVMKTTANFSWKRYNALQGACSPAQRSMIWTPISASTTSQSLSWKRKCGSPPTMAETIREPSALHTRDPFFRNIGLLKSGTFAQFPFWV